MDHRQTESDPETALEEVRTLVAFKGNEGIHQKYPAV
jgi:hypothetical protein